jgi:acyl-CoA reductase-like NAD-dependent aldehyde dehydrogenase
MHGSANDNVTLSIDPATGQTLSVWPLADKARIEFLLEQSSRSFAPWAQLPIAQRAAILHRIAAELRRSKQALARSITLEMGKPITEAEAEVEKSAWNCEFVAEHGPGWLTDEKVATPAQDSYVSYLPIGVVLAILPWNFPVWQIFRCAASALMAGNTILLKHAPNVQGCAMLVIEILERAGLPTGVFLNLHAPVEAIGAVIADRRIAAVTLTGSPAAGAKVAAQAGAACKKSILELGGSDAFIVLADADLDAAVAAGIRARFTNCGQVCLAAKRFIIEASIADAFTERFVAAAAALRQGSPLERSTQIGPMARADLRDGVAAQINASVAGGAKLLTGGQTPAGAGFFYEPTVLAGVTSSMPAAAEETFGPVAALLTARDADDAISMANDSPYGLSAMVWTRDLDRARAAARVLQVGSVFINSVTASDPRLPVGGVKLSGYGRELGRNGMLELCNQQTVWVMP